MAAGPGSGKTRVLVHKLAALLLLEDVKHEQLLMLTFSRAAATEFKKRLYELIENAAAFVEIKTFHSYCFDLLGKIGSLENAQNVVREAAQMIRDGEVELGRITKTVIVIDEAQDMDGDEFALIRALAERNDNMQVIAVGDDFAARCRYAMPVCKKQMPKEIVSGHSVSCWLTDKRAPKVNLTGGVSSE